MTEATLRQNKHGQPVLTIRVTGDAEIFRFAFYLGHGPVDHIPIATRVFRYLRRRWGIAKFKAHDQRITGGKVVQHGWQVDRRQD